MVNRIVFTNSLTFNISLGGQMAPESFSGPCSPTTPTLLFYKKTIKQTFPFLEPYLILQQSWHLKTNKPHTLSFKQVTHKVLLHESQAKKVGVGRLSKASLSQMSPLPHHLFQVLSDVWVRFMWQRCQSWQRPVDPEGHGTDTEAIFIVLSHFP